MRREVFGPVVSVTRLATPSRWCSGPTTRDYGLASSVWTRDPALPARWPATCSTAAPGINTHFMLTSEMPHGGMKMSGYGKDISLYALEDYTVPRHHGRSRLH